jgi:two-component system phosphate regulon sensor histidine kinase PhoR
VKTELTPKEVAQKTAPLIAALSAIAVLFLLHVLGSIHLWALAILVGLVMEYMSAMIIERSVDKFVDKQVQLLSDVISKVKDGGSDLAKGTSSSEGGSEDATDLIQWANQQAESMQQMHAKDNFRKEFIGNLAHELKTPLFNIQGFVLTLLESDLDNKELNQKFLSKAAKNISRMAELLDDLDTIARLESANLQMKMGPVDILSILNETLESLESKTRQNDIEITLSIAPEVKANPIVLCGGSQIRQVFVNLIGNSIHYGKPGGRTEVILYKVEDQIQTIIKDNGIGISEEDMGRIFERFYRVDRSRSRNSGGSGLGLAIVKHIMEAHSQDIVLTSELGKGTSFTFHLQQMPATSAPLHSS